MNDGARTGNGYAAHPLSYAEIEAWSRLTDTPIRPFEVAVIKRLDSEFRAWTRGEDEPPPKKQSLVAQLRALKDGITATKPGMQKK